MPYAIVVKLSSNQGNPQLGFVQPIIIENEDSAPRSSNPMDFPNSNSIFITSGYNEYIEDRFTPNDAFRISFYANSQYATDIDMSRPNYCHFVAKGNDATVLSKSEYLHVVKTAINLKQRQVMLPYKPKRYILALDLSSAAFTGPFDYDEPQYDNASGLYTVNLKAMPYLSGLPSLTQWAVLKKKYDSTLLVSLSEQLLALFSIDDLSKGDHEEIDFIHDDQLVKWVNDIVASRDHKIDKKTISEIREAISSSELSDNRFGKERLARASNLLDRTEYFVSQRSRIIADYLSTDSGREYISQFLTTNLETVLGAAKERIDRELEKKYGNLEEKRIQFQKEILQLTNERNQIQEDINKTKEELSQKKEGELTAALKSIEENIASKNIELSAILNNLNLSDRIRNLKEEEYRLKRNIEEYEIESKGLLERRGELQATLGQIKSDVSSSNEQLRRKLLELKPYVDLLNGYEAEPLWSKKPLPKRHKISTKQPDSFEELCGIVSLRLNQLGRNIDLVATANLLASVHQNFLTVIAGQPGTGKTSLITFLSAAMGLVQNESHRYLHVSTARGWTSQRDILGFFNSLTGRFHPSPTGLFGALSNCNEENIGSSDASVPFWTLLDEANLSPMEHYWSSFMPMCDSYFDRNISTGAPGSLGVLKIPQYFRFIATVNFDHTTERLSPRIIDRVPIIQILPGNLPSLPSSDTSFIKEAGSFDAFPYELLEVLMKPNDTSLSEDETRLFSSLILALHSNDLSKYAPPVVLSSRKQFLIKAFCSMTRSVMKSRYDLCSMDYAIAQHVLPLINGNGDSFRQRLVEISKITSSLDLTKRLLDRIIAVGDSEHGYYQYFC